MRNTIVAQLPRTGSKWLYQILTLCDFTAFHEPVGGWAKNEFENEQSWNLYIETRFQVRASNFPQRNRHAPKRKFLYDARECIQNNTYIELGYSSLPFIVNCPPNWKLIGVVRHPKTWIASALTNFIFQRGEIFPPELCPQTPEDYAQLWVKYNTTIKNVASVVLRLEDLAKNPEIFMYHFGYYKPLTEEQKALFNGDINNPRQKTLRKEYDELTEKSEFWGIVKELAEQFDYRKA